MSLKHRLVSQFHHPSGSWGRLAGWIMAHRQSNLARNRWTVDLLDLQPADTVCELGPGPGVTLDLLLNRCDRVIAIDHSRLMLNACRARHRRAIAADRLELHKADFTALPDFGLVDKIIAVNALQFDALNTPALVGIAAHLKPGGSLAVTFQPRGQAPTEQQAADAALRTADLLKTAGLTEQTEHRLPLAPVSAVCIVAHAPLKATSQQER